MVAVVRCSRRPPPPPSPLSTLRALAFHLTPSRLQLLPSEHGCCRSCARARHL
jgi:hypothetical protein